MLDIGRDDRNNKTCNEPGEECSMYFVAFDLVGANLPAFLFFFAGIINFYRIRSIGFNRVVQFSRLFILKRNLCYLIAFMELVYFIIAMTMSD